MKRAAVIGWPVSHSLSPRLHGYWLKKYRIDGTYEALAVEPENLPVTLRTLAQKGFSGVNLTVPHKETALGLVDNLDETARRAGAVNTIIVGAHGKLEGRNTDVFGFAENLRAAGVSVKDKTVVLLGAGGAARAAIVALQDMGAVEVRIVNRTQDRAERLAAAFPKMKISVHGWDDRQALENAVLLANATVLGMQGQPPLMLDLAALPPGATVTDMVYAPLETDLLKRAKARGLKTVDGLGMLLQQARPAFALFFGTDPEVDEELRRYMLADDFA